MTPPATFAAALLLLGFGHVLPDGVIERAAQVTIFPDHVEIRYHIGCNEATLADQLRQLDPQHAPPADADEGFERYREAILPKLAQQIQVHVGDQPREVEPVESKRIFLHHAQVQCTYRVPIAPPETATGLRIHDTSFPDTPGSHRLAAKGRAGVVVTDTNVPPILARVEWRDVEQLSEEQLEERRRIEARFQLAATISSGREAPSLAEQPALDPAPAEPAPAEPRTAGQPQLAEEKGAPPTERELAALEPRGEESKNREPDIGPVETPARPEVPQEAGQDREISGPAGGGGPRSMELVYRTTPNAAGQAPEGPSGERAEESGLTVSRPAPLSGRSLLLLLGIAAIVAGSLLRIVQHRRRRES